MTRGCCTAKFRPPVKSKTKLYADLILHFYNHRVKECNPNYYVGADTTRVYSLDPSGASTATRVIDVFRSSSLIRHFTDAFDTWYSLNPKPTNLDYDKFHELEVRRFYEELTRLGIYKRTGNRKGSPPGLLGNYYNSFAKPYNLLIWHHAFGCDGRVAPYSRTGDINLSICLHPAMDKFIFQGMIDVLTTISKPPIKIPRGGFTYLRTKSDYDTLISYLRSLMNEPLVFEGFWG